MSTKNAGEGTAVVLSDPKGNALGVFIVPTKEISETDKATLHQTADHYGQFITFLEVDRWSGIEAVKQGIKELNGDTEEG